MEIWSNWWRQKFKKMLQFFLYQVWDTRDNNGKYFNKYEEVNIKLRLRIVRKSGDVNIYENSYAD